MFENYTNYEDNKVTSFLPAEHYTILLKDFNSLIAIMDNNPLANTTPDTIRNNNVINSFTATINTYVREDITYIQNSLMVENRTNISKYENGMTVFIRAGKDIFEEPTTMTISGLGIVPLRLDGNKIEKDQVYLLQYMNGVFTIITFGQLGNGQVSESIKDLTNMLTLIDATIDEYIKDKPIPIEFTTGISDIESEADLFLPEVEEYLNINQVDDIVEIMNNLHKIYPEFKPINDALSARMDIILSGREIEEINELSLKLEIHEAKMLEFYDTYIVPLSIKYLGSQERYQDFLDEFDIKYTVIDQTPLNERIDELREFDNMLVSTMDNYGPALIKDENFLTAFKDRLLGYENFVFEDVDDLDYKSPVRLLPLIDLKVETGFTLIDNFIINDPSLLDPFTAMKSDLSNTDNRVQRLIALETLVTDKYSVYNTSLSGSQSEALAVQQSNIKDDKRNVTDLFDTLSREGYTKEYLETMDKVTPDIQETSAYFSYIENKAEEFQVEREHIQLATENKLKAESNIEAFQVPIDVFNAGYNAFKLLYEDMKIKQERDIDIIRTYGTSTIGDDNVALIPEVIETVYCFKYDSTHVDGDEQTRTKILESIDFAENLIASLPYINLTSSLNGVIIGVTSEDGADFGGEFDDYFSDSSNFDATYPKVNGLIVDGMYSTSVSCYTIMRAISTTDTGDGTDTGGGGIVGDSLTGESNDDGSAVGLEGVGDIDFRTIKEYIVENLNTIILGKGDGDPAVTVVTNGIPEYKDMLMVPILDDGLHLLCYNTRCMEFIVCNKHDEDYTPLIAINLTEFGLEATASPTSFHYGDGTIALKVKEHGLIFIKNINGDFRAISSSLNADVVGFRGIITVLDGMMFYGLGMDTKGKILEYARLPIPEDLLFGDSISPYTRVPETHSHLIRSSVAGKTVTNLALIYLIEQSTNMLKRVRLEEVVVSAPMPG